MNLLWEYLFSVKVQIIGMNGIWLRG
jgi:hypothetical protein